MAFAQHEPIHEKITLNKNRTMLRAGERGVKSLVKQPCDKEGHTNWCKDPFNCEACEDLHFESFLWSGSLLAQVRLDSTKQLAYVANKLFSSNGAWKHCKLAADLAVSATIASILYLPGVAR